jgi:pimeloyl-ACP methyl ester carboxylesterase
MKKIYILHGWTYTLNAWAACVKELQALGIETVFLNVPGLTEKTDKAWTIDEYVEWLGEKLGNEKDVILLGHSNGGRIAIAYALKNPGKISRLILEDSAGIIHNELPLRIKRAVFGTVAKAGKAVVSSERARKVFYKLIGGADYERAPVHMRETMRNMITTDLAPKLSNVASPTLLLWGRKDKATPVSDAALMHEKIQGSKLVVFPDAGHSPHATHPALVAQNIADWLE